jgi:rhodanese-related sulfurtransferase
LETGPGERVTAEIPPLDAAPVTAFELKAILDSGEPAAVLDLSYSLDYRRGHIPSAAWGLRGRFEALPLAFGEAGLVIVTGDDPGLLRLAAPEVGDSLPKAIVRVLDGGNQAWRDAGFSLEQGTTWMLSDPDDVWHKPYENEEAVEREMRAYLEWEVALVEKVRRDGDARFRLP